MFLIMLMSMLLLQMRFERRFASGLQFLTNYSFSKFTEATDRLNPGDSSLQYRIADEDRPPSFRIERQL